MRAEPTLVGRTYGDALHAYELGCPIGLRRAGRHDRAQPAAWTP